MNVLISSFRSVEKHLYLEIRFFVCKSNSSLVISLSLYGWRKSNRLWRYVKFVVLISNFFIILSQAWKQPNLCYSQTECSIFLATSPTILFTFRIRVSGNSLSSKPNFSQFFWLELLNQYSIFRIALILVFF
jgi:hypothetical protein